MMWHAGLSALLAVGAADAAGIRSRVAEGYLLSERSSQFLPEKRMADNANHVVDTSHARVAVRQNAVPVPATNPNGTLDMAAWDTQVNAACIAALSKLPQATNPSGACTCYNLPALNNVTGAFEAELRVYQISTARDEFAGIPASQVQVALSYNGASVSPVSQAEAATKIVPRQAQASNTGNSNKGVKMLPLLQSYFFVGQVDANRMKPGMTMTDLEAFVIPVVTLSAVNAAGKTVSTNVSSNEASFVAGAFANSVVLSATAKAQVAVDLVTAGLRNRTMAFVLPGVNLLIFPIGLIITGTWFVIGLSVIGFGFFERVQYRESYRRRVAIAEKGATVRRI